MHRTTCFIVIVAMIITSTGCTHTQVFNPEHLYHDTNKTIIVHLKDGGKIQFNSGDYEIIQLGTGILKGKGKLLSNENSIESKSFVGIIDFNEIQKITVSQTSPLGNIFIAGLIGFIVILFALSQIKVHHT